MNKELFFVNLVLVPRFNIAVSEAAIKILRRATDEKSIKIDE